MCVNTSLKTPNGETYSCSNIMVVFCRNLPPPEKNWKDFSKVRSTLQSIASVRRTSTIIAPITIDWESGLRD